MTDTTPTDTERADLVASLGRSRYFLRNTLRGLSDTQAAQRTTISELTLGGLIKHVTMAERQWTNFITEGPSAMGAAGDQQALSKWMNGFHMLDGETVADLLDAYAEVAQQTDDLIISLPDLNASQPLPSAPWFEPGARWSVRRVALHLIAEIAQHAGHADILRESLDGSKSMG